MCRRWVCVFRNSIQWRTAQASADPHQRVTHSPRTIIITIKLFFIVNDYLLATSMLGLLSSKYQGGSNQVRFPRVTEVEPDYKGATT